MSRYQEFIARKQREHGEQFDAGNLAPQFVLWFNTGDRIRVTYTYPSGEQYTRTGRVGVTTGHRPCFLLLHRSTDQGSSDVLSTADRVVAVQDGRHYYEIAS